MEENNNEEKSSLTVPISIVAAGLLVAATIYFTSAGVKTNPGDNQAAVATVDESSIKIKPISPEDHLIGDPNAPVKIVEYSDLECPFCKNFHFTMEALMQSDYGKSGKVAWVFRHFPLERLHPKAPKEAEATECANELGGNLKFWEFTNKLFEVTPSNNGLDLAQLPEIAEGVGIDRKNFEACLDSGKYKDKVAESLNEAIDAGGTGTPWSVVLAKNGKTFLINGAQKYETVTSIIDQALAEE